MRVVITGVLTITVALGLVGVAGAQEPPADPGRNVTCRLDAQATPAAAVALVSCANIDPAYPEYTGSVTVTLQGFWADEWRDLGEGTCEVGSTEGYLELPCEARNGDPSQPATTYRGIVDLNSPKDWAPAVAEPEYHGGDPASEALATDDCGLAEVVDDNDLTLYDGPGSDLCDLYVDSVASADRESLESLTVEWVVFKDAVIPWAGTGSWSADLAMGDCVHTFVVAENGVIGDPQARVETRCGGENIPCTGPVWDIINQVYDLIWGGGACSAGTNYDLEETHQLDPALVQYGPISVSITLTPDALSPLLSNAFTPGSVIESANATAFTGVGTGDDGSNSHVFDVDFADSTGRTHTIGG